MRLVRPRETDIGWAHEVLIMLDVTQRITIQCPAHEVFALITDVEATPRWSDAIIRIVRQNQGPLKVGDAFTEEASLMGRVIRTEKVISELEENRIYAERAEGGMLPHAVRMTLSTQGDATELTFRLSGNPGRAAKLYGPLLGRALKKQIGKDLKTMKAILEAQSP